MAMTIISAIALTTLLAQIPNPTPAINAAKDARAKTEAAQQKNADALAADQKPAPAAAQRPAVPGRPGAAAEKDAPPAQGSPVGYSYDPSGRRDPFVSLTARGGDLPSAPGTRPAGLPGMLVGEVTVKGIFKSPKGGFLALLQAPDGRTYSVKQGDKVFDGSVKAITQDAVVFSQDVNDPLSLVKQREVRKSIRPEAR
jgi:Tfp pilus assembly protein PilP